MQLQLSKINLGICKKNKKIKFCASDSPKKILYKIPELVRAKLILVPGSKNFRLERLEELSWVLATNKLGFWTIKIIRNYNKEKRKKKKYV